MPSWREAKVFSSPTSLSHLERLLSLFKNIHFALNEISWNITRGHKSLEIFFFLTADVKIRSILPPDKLYSTLYFHVTSTNAKGVNKYDLITVENDTRVWPI